MFLGAAMTEVFSNLFIPHVVGKRDCLVSEQLIGMPLEILGDSLGGICCKYFFKLGFFRGSCVTPWLNQRYLSALQSSIVMTALEIN